MLHYCWAFISACLQHRLSWWASLFATYIFGIGLFSDYGKIRTKLIDSLNLSSLPDQIPAWWLVIPFLVWLVVAFAHREVMRKLYAGRVIFDSPGIIYDVPLFQRHRGVSVSAGDSAVTQVGPNDIAYVNVCNVPYDSANGKAIERAFGSVIIFDSNWQRIKTFDFPRWKDNQSPGYEGSPSDHFPDDWNFRTLHPNGSKNRMDLFIKRKIDSLAYGFRGYSQLKPLWQDAELSIQPGRYKILIRVNGTPMNYSAGTWVELENPGQNASIRIDRLPFSVTDYWRRRRIESEAL